MEENEIFQWCYNILIKYEIEITDIKSGYFIDSNDNFHSNLFIY